MDVTHKNFFKIPRCFLSDASFLNNDLVQCNMNLFEEISDKGIRKICLVFNEQKENTKGEINCHSYISRTKFK